MEKDSIEQGISPQKNPNETMRNKEIIEGDKMTNINELLGRPIKPGWKFYWVEGNPHDSSQFHSMGEWGARELCKKFDNPVFRRCNCLVFESVIGFKKGGAPKELVEKKFKALLYEDDKYSIAAQKEKDEKEVPIYLIEEVK